MMAWMLLFIVIVAVWHYIWDGIVSPSLRAQYRFALFELRDRVREMRIRDELDEKRFMILHDSINAAVQLIVPSITVSALYQSQRAIENDPALRRAIEERSADLRASDNPEVEDIMAKVARTVYRALVMNSGGWFIFVVPAWAVVRPISQVYALIQKLVTLTEREVAGFFPEQPGRAMPMLQ